MHDDFYQMYLDELKEIPPCTKEEEEQLLFLITKGDKDAKQRLTEGNLQKALNVAREYDGQGVLLTDLVQEANMALLAAVDAYSDFASTTGGSFEELLNKTFAKYLNQAVAEQREAGVTGEELAARVNVLQDIAGLMAKELGREATPQELAHKMKMTEDEVLGIMKMAMDAISTNAENMDMEALAGAEGIELVETMEEE